MWSVVVPVFMLFAVRAIADRETAKSKSHKVQKSRSHQISAGGQLLDSESRSQRPAIARSSQLQSKEEAKPDQKVKHSDHPFAKEAKALLRAKEDIDRVLAQNAQAKAMVAAKNSHAKAIPEAKTAIRQVDGGQLLDSESRRRSAIARSSQLQTEVEEQPKTEAKDQPLMDDSNVKALLKAKEDIERALAQNAEAKAMVEAQKAHDKALSDAKSAVKQVMITSGAAGIATSDGDNTDANGELIPLAEMNERGVPEELRYTNFRNIASKDGDVVGHWVGNVEELIRAGNGAVQLSQKYVAMVSALHQGVKALERGVAGLRPKVINEQVPKIEQLDNVLSKGQKVWHKHADKHGIERMSFTETSHSDNSPDNHNDDEHDTE